jgi:protein-disulfide isomerase
MSVARGAGKQIIADYVDTGKVRYTFRHFPFLDDRSYRAAEAGDCAAEQGKFLEWHRRLADAWESTGASLENDRLRAYAGELGLDVTAFDECFNSRRYEGSVLAEKEAGKAAGVRTTPTMFIDGTFLQGQKTYEEYRTAIEQALSAVTAGDEG